MQASQHLQPGKTSSLCIWPGHVTRGQTVYTELEKEYCVKSNCMLEH